MDQLSRKQFKKRMAVLAVIALLTGILIGLISARADEGSITAYVICQPGDWVNARRSASRKSESLGMMECGDAVQLDGKTRNGYAHMVDAHLEEDEAWIHAGYVGFDRPEWVGKNMRIAKKRVAARKYADGPVRVWLNKGDTVTVFWMSDEWSVTSRGFVMTKYLEDEAP